jgi:hypothetical protein
MKGDSNDIYLKMLLDKNEKTQIIENTNQQLNNTWRSILIDRNPDPPMLESDMPRRRFGGKERLMLQETGTRSGSYPPIHKINLSFTDNDKRGNILKPDRRKIRNHSEKYDSFYPLSSDADNSIPSQSIHPAIFYSKMKRKVHPWFGKFLKMFSTPRNNIQTSSSIPKSHISLVNRIVTSGFSDSKIHQRPNRTIISDNFDINYEQITDNNFFISKNGILYKNAPQKELKSPLVYITSNLQSVGEHESNIPRNVVKAIAYIANKNSNHINHMTKNDTNRGTEIIINTKANNRHQNKDISRFVKEDSEYYNSIKSFANRRHLPTNTDAINYKTESDINLFVNENLSETSTKKELTIPKRNQKERYLTEINPQITLFMKEQTRRQSNVPHGDISNIKNKTLSDAIQQNLRDVPIFIKRHRPFQQENLQSNYDHKLSEFLPVHTIKTARIGYDNSNITYKTKETQDRPVDSLSRNIKSSKQQRLDKLNYATKNDIGLGEFNQDNSKRKTIIGNKYNIRKRVEFENKDDDLFNSLTTLRTSRKIH